MHHTHHALVLGGGIGGLATAGVLSRHFERVTLVEQDGYGETESPRRHTRRGRISISCWPAGC